MRRFWWLVCFPIVFLIGYCYFPHKKGFNFHKVLPFVTYQSEWTISPSAPLRDIFSQPFIFLTSGSQSFVFISQDQKYVIKFFKNNRLTPKKWLKHIDLPGLSALRYEKVVKREENLKRQFDLIKSIFDQCKEDVGLVYVHLNPSKDLKIHLPLLYQGQKFQVDLDEYPFLLQERAELIYPRLTRLMKDHDRAGAVNAMRALLNLIRNRSERGFEDFDNGYSKNYGYIGERAIQIDIGFLAPSTNRSSPVHEIQKVGEMLKGWVESNCPDLLPDLENLMSEFKAD